MHLVEVTRLPIHDKPSADLEHRPRICDVHKAFVSRSNAAVEAFQYRHES